MPPRSTARGVAVSVACSLLLPAAKPAVAALELSCPRGRVTMSARGEPALAVFRALERECGLVLRRAELIPEGPVTAEYRGRTLEEAVRDLVRITGIPSTLSTSAPGEPLTLVLLPTGHEDPTRRALASVPAGATAGGSWSALSPLPADVRAALSTAPGPADPETLLALIRRVDADEAWVAEGLLLDELLELRAEAAAEEALRRYHAARDEEGRRLALAELAAAGPSLATGEAWTAEEADDERWRLDWERARADALFAPPGPEREHALARLRESNPDELGFLDGLDTADLGREQRWTAVDALLERYYLALTPEQWKQRYGARKPRDLEERIEDLPEQAAPRPGRPGP